MLSGLAHAGVALAKEAGVRRRVNELLACPVQQSAVGGARDGLGLHRRVQHHRVQARALDHTPTLGSLDALRQQPLAARFTDALGPAHQAGRITGQLMLEVALAAEVLPVRVLAPALDGVLVAQRVDVLEVQQRSHQPRGQCWSAGGGYELRAPLVGEGLPVDQLGQAKKFMALVDEVYQFRAKQIIVICRLRRLRTHRQPRCSLQGTDIVSTRILQSPPSASAPIARIHASSEVFQGRLDIGRLNNKPFRERCTSRSFAKEWFGCGTAFDCLFCLLSADLSVGADPNLSGSVFCRRQQNWPTSGMGARRPSAR